MMQVNENLLKEGNMRLKGKTAIITGAGRGIGFAYADRFLQEGAKVVIAEINEETGKKAAESLSSKGEVVFVKTDITDEASSENVAKVAREQFGSVDILVNNAALYGGYDSFNNDLSYLKKVFEINLFGQWLVAKAVTPYMIEQKSGRIINVASIAGCMWQMGKMIPPDTGLGSFAYHQSKWGVVGMTRLLAGHLGAHNITVNCIAPGVTLTEGTEEQIPAEFHSFFTDQTAMGRIVQPEDIVGTAVYFASDDASFVTGQLIVIDGGGIMPV